MKANELMIGDWVCAIDTIGASRCIAHILELKDVPYLACGIWGEIHKYELLEPIPLTPRILEGSGFSFGNTTNEDDCDNPAEKGWCYCDENGEVKVTFPHGTEGGEIYVNNYSFRYIRLVFPDKIYLHELQHALRLCGIDKEIIL